MSEDVCPTSFEEAVIIFDEDAEQDDELTLRVGQVSKNKHVVEEGWAEELLRKVGMFSANFVEMRKASPLPILMEDCPPPPVDEGGRHLYVYISCVY